MIPARILINGLHAKSGGGITYLREIVPRLARRGELEILLLLHRNQRADFNFGDTPVEIIEAEYSPGFIREILWEQFSLPGLAKRHEAEAVFSPANFGPLRGAANVILLRNALEVGDHDTRLSKRFYWFALGIMTRLCVNRACRIIAVSKYAAGALAGRRKTAHPKLTVIPHGVSPDFTPADANADPAPAFLLAVGDLYIQKNYPTLIDAFALTAAKYPSLELRIAGAEIDHNHAGAIRQKVTELGLENRVKFLGRKDRTALVELYRNCSAFIFPSTAETFGQPLVEAMASGAPVVASDRTAIPEIAGGAALLCDPLDADALARHIGSLLEDDAFRKAQAEKAAVRGKAFSWDACAERTAGILIDAARDGAVGITK